jgi:hypothetical protein
MIGRRTALFPRCCATPAPPKGRHDQSRRSYSLDVPAALRKWPSLNGQRISAADGAAPYTVFEGNLGECIREFLTKPGSHLYEIFTEPQPAFDQRILVAPDVNEITARAEFR